MIYDGFFDTTVDPETGQYDVSYGIKDFTGYFAEIIGTGVCVYKNPESMKVRYEEGKAIVHYGYAFINGYWVEICEYVKDELTGNYNKILVDYEIPVTVQDVPVYIVARLDLGGKKIHIEQTAEIEENSICFAKLTLVDGVVNVGDTRYDAELCGVIESLGDISVNLDYVLKYIDEEIEKKLQQIEQDLQAQSEAFEKKLQELQAETEKLEPPAIGTVKFSASQNVDAKWLRCDGSFINQTDYPELVEVLGKLKPASNDFFEIAKNNNIGTKLSNLVPHDDFLYIFSQTASKLYKIAKEGDSVTEISVSFENGEKGSSFHNSSPVYLSIIENDVFLTQTNNSTAQPLVRTFKGTLSDSGISAQFQEKQSFLDEQTLTEVSTVIAPIVGYVDGYYYMFFGLDNTGINRKYRYMKWKSDSVEFLESFGSPSSKIYLFTAQGFSKKNNYASFEMSGDNMGNNRLMYIPQGTVVTIDYDGNASFEIGENIPIIGGMNSLMYKIALEEKKPRAMYVDLLQKKAKGYEIQNITLSNNSKVYPDSISFCAPQNLWVCFVGTGFLFTRNPEDAASWGYLDTTDILGIITQSAGCYYIDEDLAFYFYGMTFDNKFKIAKLKTDKWYQYASDGAFLPYIESDGVPAYIKAKGDDVP